MQFLCYMKILKKITPLLCIIPLLFLYQNCGSGFNSQVSQLENIDGSLTSSSLINNYSSNNQEPNTEGDQPKDNVSVTDNTAKNNPSDKSPPPSQETLPATPVDEQQPTENTSAPDKITCDHTAYPSNLQSKINSLDSGTICLKPGNYGQVIIENKLKTSSAKPFRLMPDKDAEGLVKFVGDSFAKSTMIRVYNSKHIEVYGLYFTNAQKAIVYASVQGGLITQNTISNIGMEAIHVGRFYGGKPRGDLPSSYIEVSHNIIENTGLLKDSSGAPNPYGEGIYIGNGSDPKTDKTHDILIYKNTISNTSAEAIELKPFTSNIQVIENIISEVSLIHSGAITVGVGSETIEKDSNHLVQGNKIFNVTSRKYSVGGIVVAVGKTTLIDNEVYNIEGGRDIRIYKSMTTANKEFHKVMLRGNKANNIEINQSNGSYNGANAQVIHLD